MLEDVQRIFRWLKCELREPSEDNLPRVLFLNKELLNKNFKRDKGKVMLDKSRLRIAIQKSGRLSEESRELLLAVASKSIYNNNV